jgi:uroporphyrinogen-III synthase
MVIGEVCAKSSKMRRNGSGVWITRTDPFNRLTAKRLAALGFESLCLPALRVHPLADRRPIAVPDALIFTSPNGVRFHDLWPGLFDVDVFTVGDRTARYARAAGYRHVVAASGNVADLARLVCGRMPPGVTALHIGAAHPAGDLDGLLAVCGIRLARRPIYSVTENDLSDVDYLKARSHDISTIMVHSPRAATNVAAWLCGSAPAWQGDIVCISDAAAAPFQHLPGLCVKVAVRPDEPSMLDCLNTQRVPIVRAHPTRSSPGSIEPSCIPTNAVDFHRALAMIVADE